MKYNRNKILCGDFSLNQCLGIRKNKLKVEKSKTVFMFEVMFKTCHLTTNHLSIKLNKNQGAYFLRSTNDGKDNKNNEN